MNSKRGDTTGLFPIQHGRKIVGWIGRAPDPDLRFVRFLLWQQFDWWIDPTLPVPPTMPAPARIEMRVLRTQPGPHPIIYSTTEPLDRLRQIPGFLME